jgi:hypothetical protein
MPLRDHFHSPLSDRSPWDAVHGLWPAMIVIGLNRKLPERYVAGPCIHLGSSSKPEPDSYEVRVYDEKHGRRLVAAIEIVSPANKDRPDHRHAFVTECAALLQNQVCVVIVDIVTSCAPNLYADLMEFFGQPDPSPAGETARLSAVACRRQNAEDAWRLEAWAHPLEIGKPLPTLPLWLAEDLAIPLDLEASYEETCQVLRIP